MRTRLLNRIPLQRGAHPDRDGGLCAMEMVAWLAGEEHSDSPQCTCPTIAAYVRALNDFLPSDHARDQILRPLIPRLVNTRTNLATELRRGYRIADHAARVLASMTLDSLGRKEEAESLRTLSPVVDRTSAHRAARVLASYGPAVRATAWLLRRTADGAAPATLAAAGARAAHDAGSDEAFTRAADLVAELAELRQPTAATR